ncbi:phosphate ABC transporter permease subunit PstC [Desulfohalovibrio reitneri]|uniref:phosphate ABC transporter permease subunit PstC n=1 Tax=Desulfohalovibrio reitneri TaxID=1307759 RepID=UPI0004A7228B|nr:phosphate ABC transporter permease subunit PstC [Desulfohalovibrio reitneri]
MSTSFVFQYLLLGLIPLGVLAFFLSRSRVRVGQARGERFHSTSGSYGWYGALWVVLPPLIVAVLAAFGELVHLWEVPGPMLLAAGLGLGAAGLLFALRRIAPDLRARDKVEKVIVWTLIVSSLISILTTIGIVISIVVEAIRFFNIVSLWDFLTGTTWSPDTAFLGGAGRAGENVAEPEFGSVPIFAGTFMITAIAMLVAIPIGLFAAIFMSEYADTRTRKFAKPTLEILAGIPTVVYGYFAAITVSPLIVRAVEAVGLNADYTNALAPGLVMGVMIIPLVSSLSDDVISSVPQHMREGSYALGATTSETIKKVVLPAALPGVVSAFLLAVSRAVGETMIVVMAAGLRPNLTANPLEGMTTVTVRIVAALTGDQSFDSPETLSAFGLGLVLLVLTLVLNVISLVIIRKFRQKYE